MNSLDALTLTPLPAIDEDIRASVRGFLREALANLPASVRARSWFGYDSEFSREAGRRGFLGLTVPKAYGGAGRSAFARYVVVEEFLNAGAPVGSHWIAERQSAPLILKYGTEEQKAFYVPAICRGESCFCIGMSEPEAGSDLAGVKTRATREDAGWLLNGRKIWTTNAHNCDYMIALVRTSGGPDDRHKGLSQLVIDLKLPGVTVSPIRDLTGDAHFCEVVFDNVRLPASAVLGREGDGWQQVVSELAFERSGPERIFSSIVLFDEWLAWVRTAHGRSPASLRLAGRLLSQLAPLRAMSIALTARLERGESPVTEAALLKDLGTGWEQSVPALIADDLYRHPVRDLPLELLRTLDYVTQIAPAYSLRGGTREILRGMIARGLGLR